MSIDTNRYIKTSAIILAAGSSRRLNMETPKQYLKINDREIIDFSIQTFKSIDKIDEIILVVSEQYLNKVKKKYPECIVVIGGENRKTSSYNGLLACSENINKVLTIAGWDIERLTNNYIKTYNKKQPRGVEYNNEGYTDILGGCCGFLITKKICPFDYKEIFELNPNDEKYYVDDVFISGFLTLNNTDIYLIPNTIRRDEQRSINDGINRLEDHTRLQKNIKCIQYFKNKYNIWN